MKLHTIELAFREIKGVFNAFDIDESGTIEWGELSEAMSKMDCSDSDQDVIAEIFKEANFYENASLTLKEFIVALALAFLLELIPVNAVPNRIIMSAAFTLILEAWIIFDPEATGSLDQSKMRKTLRAQANNHGRNSKLRQTKEGPGMLSADRLAEADWDQDGSITFKEFLMVFCSWVDMGEDEDEAVDC
jgi:calcium-binding protein CML